MKHPFRTSSFVLLLAFSCSVRAATITSDLIKSPGVVTQFDESVATDELLVFLDASADASAFAARHGLTLESSLKSVSNGYVFSAQSSDAALTFSDALKFDADVTSSYLNTISLNERNFVPNDPYFNKDTPAAGWPGQWHLQNQHGGPDVQVTGAWNNNITGSGVIIGIVDDSLETTHPDLAPNYIAADSWDFGHNDGNPDPVNSDDHHGISVAGVAAAKGWQWHRRHRCRARCRTRRFAH